MRRFSAPELLVLTLVLASVAACAPIAREPNAPSQVDAVLSQGVSVTPQRRGDALVLDIRSETGIGDAQISLSDDAEYDDIILRLRLRGLEGLTFTYPGATVMVSISSHDLSVREQARAGESASLKTIAPGSPYWMEVGILREQAGAAAVIPLPDGSFDVSVPRDFLRGDATVFTLSWIDFYR
jgi:hypothetical protein